MLMTRRIQGYADHGSIFSQPAQSKTEMQNNTVGSLLFLKFYVQVR